ncbi:MAG: hypothetical protein K9N51_09945 [Candidatus Pacebacteria bacterium]|nr:hypothetical protein [Candidatus Paceibacterota bacterium]
MWKVLFNLIVLVALAVAVFWVADLLLDIHKTAKLENKAHRAYSSQDWERAVTRYTDLLRRLEQADSFRLDRARVRRTRTRIAKCYVALGRNPELPLVESLELYRRATEYDADVITDKQIKRLLELSPERLPGSGGGMGR